MCEVKDDKTNEVLREIIAILYQEKTTINQALEILENAKVYILENSKVG